MYKARCVLDNTSWLVVICVANLERKDKGVRSTLGIRNIIPRNTDRDK